MSDTRDIHDWFGLSYANYLALPRTLLQSMPDEWQHQFVALLQQFTAAFRHVEQADMYEVHAATDHIVNEMTEAEFAAAGITVSEQGEDAPAYTDADGNELSPHQRVLIRTSDPVPHYNRGRTFIQHTAPKGGGLG